ncbi:hypothetical protein [Aliivibrio fischeri]|uniref:hypothetical protein n=1 Tax=Aliivibrio fischeri TaxID=668 RepID=UPI0012D9DAD7|nr:hypothetical protein [Aliivibrio fischeri]MUJ20395.1 hypothetical protein [Aliivibrio fischeri]
MSEKIKTFNSNTIESTGYIAGNLRYLFFVFSAFLLIGYNNVASFNYDYDFTVLLVAILGNLLLLMQKKIILTREGGMIKAKVSITFLSLTVFDLRVKDYLAKKLVFTIETADCWGLSKKLNVLTITDFNELCICLGVFDNKTIKQYEIINDNEWML